MIKQYNECFNAAPYDAIQTDGCFWRTLLYPAELFTGKEFTADELKRAFHYSIPDYMEDHRHSGEDRCYIQWRGHEEIIMGYRNVDVSYRVRHDLDKDQFILGNESQYNACQFFAAKCKWKKTGHFYASDRYGWCKWNPHDVYVMSNEILSIRGFGIIIKD